LTTEFRATGRVPMKGQPIVSLHRRNAVEGMIWMIMICATLSVAEMHSVG
jgi:hypothetical protein